MYEDPLGKVPDIPSNSMFWPSLRASLMLHVGWKFPSKMSPISLYMYIGTLPLSTCDVNQPTFDMEYKQTNPFLPLLIWNMSRRSLESPWNGSHALGMLLVVQYPTQAGCPHQYGIRQRTYPLLPHRYGMSTNGPCLRFPRFCVLRQALTLSEPFLHLAGKASHVNNWKLSLISH